MTLWPHRYRTEIAERLMCFSITRLNKARGSVSVCWRDMFGASADVISRVKAPDGDHRDNEFITALTSLDGFVRQGQLANHQSDLRAHRGMQASSQGKEDVRSERKLDDIPPHPARRRSSHQHAPAMAGVRTVVGT